MIVYIIHFSVGYGLKVVVHRLLASDIDHGVLEAFVRKPVRALRVHYSDSVHLEAIWIDVGSHRAECNAPDSVFPFDHILFRRELSADFHIFRLRRRDAEGDGIVRVYYCRWCLRSHLG